MALHPHCQVLNHGGQRIFGDEDLNFLADYDNNKFDAFVRYAVHISQGGRRGYYGGSITQSHAFDHPGVKKAYQARYGDKQVKDEIRCLFWKESMRTATTIRSHQLDLDAVFEKNDQVRFLMSVRNPLDCAVSNLKTGKVGMLPGVNTSSSIEEVAQVILEELLWFLKLRESHPDRYFYYLENDFNDQTLRRWAQALDLEPDEQWIRDSLACFEMKSSYQYEPAVIQFYNQFVNDHFSLYPDLRDKLLAFVD